MMVLAGVELETLVSNPDALTTPPPLFVIFLKQDERKFYLNKDIFFNAHEL